MAKKSSKKVSKSSSKKSKNKVKLKVSSQKNKKPLLSKKSKKALKVKNSKTKNTSIKNLKKLKSKPVKAKFVKKVAAQISKNQKLNKTQTNSQKSSQVVNVEKNKLKTLKNSKSYSSLIPLKDKVLVEQSDGFSKTAGGIFIPDAYQEKPLEGKVVQVGSGLRNKKGEVRPLDVQVGDSVMFGKYAGSKIQLEGKNYLILSESDIIGVVTKP